jgi:hypothetical protein
VAELPDEPELDVHKIEILIFDDGGVSVTSTLDTLETLLALEQTRYILCSPPKLIPE